MSVCFALNLSPESVSLFHKATDGWAVVGTARLDSPDVGAALSALRDEAISVGGEDFTTKLILPNSQILYTSVDATGDGAPADEARVLEALDGATPYARDALAVDWAAQDGKLQIAAVGRQTLDEAERFAKAQGFHPVGFAAIPEPGAFKAEPFFGVTEAAQGLGLSADDLRSDTPISFGTEAAETVTELEDEIEPFEEAALGDTAFPEPVAPEPVAAAEPVPTFASRRKSQDDTAPEGEAIAEPEAVPVSTSDAAVAADSVTSHIADEDTWQPATDEEVSSLAVEDPAPTSEETALVDAAPATTPVEPLDAGPDTTAESDYPFEPEAIANTSQPPEVSAGPVPAEPVEVAAPPVDPILAADDDDAPAAAVIKPKKKRKSRRGDRKLKAAQAAATAATAATQAAAASKPQIRLEGVTRPTSDGAKKPTAEELVERFRARQADERRPEQRSNPSRFHTATPPPPRIAAALQKPDAVASELAGIGAMPVRKGGGSRLGLLLTGGLLAILASVGMWSALFLSDGQNAVASVAPDSLLEPGDSTPEELKEPELITEPQLTEPQIPEPQITVITPPDVAVPDTSGATDTQTVDVEAPKTDDVLVPAEAPTVSDKITAGLITPAPQPQDGDESLRLARLEDPLLSSLPAKRFDLAEPILDAPPEAEDPAAPLSTDISEDPAAAPTPLTLEEARRAYVADGIWQRAPERIFKPTSSDLDELYLAAIDPSVIAQDAVALPDPQAARTDRALQRQPSPVLPDAPVPVSPGDIVTATPEGALTPSGILVYAGKPWIVPPDRPEGRTVAAPPPEVAEAEAGDIQQPRRRPEGLLEGAERAQLGGRTLEELATLSPRSRPASVIQLAKAAELARLDAERKAEEEAKRVAEELAKKAEQEAAANATGTVSGLVLRNVSDPKNRGRARSPRRADRAKRIVVPKPDETQTETASASSTSRTRTGPAVPRSQRVRAPSPSRASVTRNATVANQVNLSRMNLIGVYGTSSKRRALVRLALGPVC